MSLRTIVVGVDGRDRSSRALAFSLGLAEREGARLDVCYVRPFAHWTTFVWSSVSVFCWDIGSLAQAAGDHVEAEVAAEVSDALTRSGVQGRFHLRSGDIAAELARVAREQRADLLVVGRSRRTGRGRFTSARRLTDDFRRGLLIAS